MEVIPGSVVENGNGAKPPKGKGKPAKGEKGFKAKGRMDADKQPAVTQPKVIAERLDELVHLHAAAIEAAEAAKEAITKAAEDSGYLASTVSKLVRAKHSEKLEEKHREIEQQMELFDEVCK
jgi:hypothetical protein